MFLKAASRPNGPRLMLSRCASSTPPTDVREKIVSLCKRRGFIFPNSELYGGLGGSYDYGPLGAQMKKNIRDQWWKTFVKHRSDCMGIETPIIMHNQVWHASGHIENFVDPLVECTKCKHRFRQDHIGDKLECPTNQPGCSKENLSEPREFNLLFRTHIGPVAESGSEVYLRPETAQGIFVNFNTITTVMRKQLPFGVGQVGKSFRNEISPREFLFRLREFEQMELEYFCHPSESEKWYHHWRDECMKFCTSIGLKSDHLRWAETEKGDLAHYAVASADIEFLYPTGWGELWGVANRGDYDLRAHSTASKKDLRYQPPNDPKNLYFPYVIEPALGLDRLFYALLLDAHHEEAVPGEEEGRTVLKLHKDIAPFKYAILPLSKKENLTKMATDIFHQLIPLTSADFDVAGSIGKRYRRHDEIGTPYCITVDFQSVEDQTVTVRDRDTMTQRRIHVSELLQEARE